MPLPCDCITLFNAKLAPDRKLDTSITFSIRDQAELNLTTITHLIRCDNGKPERRSGKPSFAAHSFCPFCGVSLKGKVTEGLIELLAKTTPGPWRVDDDHSDYELAIVGRPKWACTRFGVKGDWEVARVDDLLSEYPGEAKANAQLIVAAVNALPALLDDQAAQAARAMEMHEEIVQLRAVAGQMAEELGVIAESADDDDGWTSDGHERCTECARTALSAWTAILALTTHSAEVAA